MIELRWSPQSFQDLAAIRAYVADDSPVYAELTVQRIVAAVERLRIFPDSGRMVPERQSPELRELIVGKYRVVYRRSAELVEIATVRTRHPTPIEAQPSRSTGRASETLAA